jgi:hypothetical protein
MQQDLSEAQELGKKDSIKQYLHQEVQYVDYI